MSYGTSGYGVGSYGGAGSLSLSRAWAVTTHSVRVELTAAARAANPFDVGDALNPSTWEIVRSDTGAPFTVIGVRQIDDASARVFEVFTLEPFQDVSVTHAISSTTLLASYGALIIAPYSASFLGLVDEIKSNPRRARRQRWRDLANPVRIVESSGHLVGTIVIASDGDYDTEEGRAIAEKMIVRRIVTPRGAIKHLPNFGVGFAIKEPLPLGADQAKLRKEIEDQALQEPDVAAARAELQIFADGIAFIRVRGRLASGVAFDVGVRRNPDGQFVEF